MREGDTTSARATATNHTVTRLNRTAIVDALEQHGPLTRAEITERTGLASATVHRLCTRLVDEGTIAVEREADGGIGRPTHRYRFLGESRTVVAIDITDDTARGALIDMNGAVSHTHDTPLRGADGALSPTSRLDGVLQAVEDLIATAAERGTPAQGVGIAVPGLVDRSGVVGHSVELGWSSVPLRDRVAERTGGLPVVVENDANAVAVGEWARGAAQGSQHMAAFLLGVGLGAGIVADGRLLRGFRSGAGEIGSLIADRSAFARTYDEAGDLESRVLSLGAARTPGARRDSSISILDEYAEGVPTALDPAAELLDYIAISIAALSVVLDTAEVILSGRLPARADVLVSEIETRLRGRIPNPPRIVIGALGERAAVIGVGQLVIEQVKGGLYLA
ncbi:putative NBD/HSP70 family sugar kinase [Microbacterium terrae]|uniref:Glucokinase n=1 Tax=Microbacterium terrae TaxID=69369 RepID=A0A0M2HG56_9MICO|nr:ROK family transcriptional regulator [Microbacterium terrae]KJL45650.1 Glucokinase [Microbacterium terrae]MBP1076037.1 putative NBD/HSP70 family sugar kinase [Microbacterium terrae]GLJ96857.1 transcriptional regulator [Microbacterium terrae]